MKEFAAILTAYEGTDLTKRKTALATVVKVRGSSYRSPGARMLITDDGKWVGSISGGCLEGDALRKARQVMTEQKPITVTYDTQEESNQNLGIGLGCNGVIDVLIEPITHDSPHNPITIIRTYRDIKEPVVIATIFRGKLTGEKFIITNDYTIKSNFSDLILSDEIYSDVIQLFKSKKSETKEYIHNNETVEVFIELVEPTISLIIFGGGFDARPVSQLAKALGWRVSVTDECVAHIAPLFFPDVDQLKLCQRQFIDRDFQIDDYTACVLMSHNYEYDRDVLKKLIRTKSPYIGILGPRKRFDKMRDELALENILLDTNDFHRIHSPIGIDIGAETPDEIAVSIVAEIQGKFSNRPGGFLKYRQGPIHERDPFNHQVFKQVFVNVDQHKKAGNL